MSLGTTVLVCLAVLFFGGIIVLDRANRRQHRSDAGAGKPMQAPPAEMTQEPAQQSQPRSPESQVNVTPIARGKKKQGRSVPGPHAKHGT